MARCRRIGEREKKPCNVDDDSAEKFLRVSHNNELDSILCGFPSCFQCFVGSSGGCDSSLFRAPSSSFQSSCVLSSIIYCLEHSGVTRGRQTGL